MPPVSKGFLIASIYLPNGNPQPGPRFDYKLAWFERLIAHARNCYSVDAPVVLAGDFNVVPTDRDIYPSKSWSKNALLQPQTRACFQRLLGQGWVEAGNQPFTGELRRGDRDQRGPLQELAAEHAFFEQPANGFAPRGGNPAQPRIVARRLDLRLGEQAAVADEDHPAQGKALAQRVDLVRHRGRVGRVAGVDLDRHGAATRVGEQTVDDDW